MRLPVEHSRRPVVQTASLTECGSMETFIPTSLGGIMVAAFILLSGIGLQ